MRALSRLSRLCAGRRVARRARRRRQPARRPPIPQVRLKWFDQHQAHDAGLALQGPDVAVPRAEEHQRPRPSTSPSSRRAARPTRSTSPPRRAACGRPRTRRRPGSRCSSRGRRRRSAT
ncbi:MAG: hypothetical protein MZW92_07475 [Comamonadaceae bacterium]|nr:hypothetical protein [Comamonadaceae bacterium]